MPRMKRMMVHIPIATWDRMDELVRAGEFASKNEIVRVALRELFYRMPRTRERVRE